MATNQILGRDVYIALAAVGWADGQLTTEAADAIVRTALEEGLELEEIQEIEEATKKRVEMTEIDRMNMSKADRLYVYAVASWITALDGVLSDAEKDALAQLGDVLKIPEPPRRHVDEIVHELAKEGDRPDRFDLHRLRTTLAERHEAARQKRLALATEQSERPSDDGGESES